MNLDDVLPDQGHLKKYRVWFTVEVEAETPEVAAGVSASDLLSGRTKNWQLQRVEELDH